MMTDELKREFYAHTIDGEEKKNWQKLINHLTETSSLAESFGKDANVAELARISGLAHDLGKYSLEFQQRLEGKKIKVDHSTAGAKELIRLNQGTPQELLATLMAYCIAGHHSGLPNYGDPLDVSGDGTLLGRLKTNVHDFSAYLTELDLSAERLPAQVHFRPLNGYLGFSCSFMTRMVYSALVDADYQQTERAVRGLMPRGGYQSIDELCSIFNNYLQKFEHPKSAIDRKRTETLHSCVQNASLRPGFFTLTVPTGGGKTLASMAFALNHAKENGLKRIIYVIPFTTIIEQNAAVFKDILGEDNILEHHSNFDWEQKRRMENADLDDQTNNAYTKLKLAAENWDIPIVVTTNVQFFESLFANRSKRCRKLHNIAKSVIIFDEAQMLPREYMKPAMYAVWELVTNYGASAIFCTATQPNLGRFLPEGTKLFELATNPQGLFDFYHRVEIKALGKITDAELIERLNSHTQALCIVNTRKHAKGLFAGLDKTGSYHLSTLMCPAHRKAKLKEIRRLLIDGQPCRVVSTTVMEAGVDLDFPVGYRALAGLDSINQAAGRVNREMHTNLGELFVFEPESEYVKRTPKYISQTADVARNVLRKYSTTPISIAAIQAYFEDLYSLKDPQEFDCKRILDCFSKSRPTMLDFADAAEKFQVIEDVTVPVIIPYNKEATRLIDELKTTPYPSSKLRKLQPYTVNIYEQEFESLQTKGAIETIADTYSVLADRNCYNEQTGLVIPIDYGGNAIIY